MEWENVVVKEKNVNGMENVVNVLLIIKNLNTLCHHTVNKKTAKTRQKQFKGNKSNYYFM